MARKASGRTGGAGRSGVTVRLAIALAALGIALLGPSTAGAAVRSEFFGIVQGPTLDDQDMKALRTAHVHTVRYLFQWESVQPTSKTTFRWGTQDNFIGRWPQGDPGASRRSGEIRSGSTGYTARAADRPARRTRLAWQAFLKAVVERYGPDGDYWRAAITPTYGPNATPLPITSWQIWNEPNLKKYFVPYPAPEEVRHAAPALPQRDQEQSTRTAQIVLGGMPGYGDVNGVGVPEASSTTRSPSVKRNFDAAALHPYGEHRSIAVRDPDRSDAHGDEAATADARHAALDLGDRLGLGAAGQRRDQPRAAGPGAACSGTPTS